jgi:acetyl esterase
MEWFMNHYVSDTDRTDAKASPMLHSSLEGLPDCFVATCEFDPLRDEGEAYADALRDSGVRVESKRYDGLIHGVANMADVLDGGRELVADVGRHLRAALHA